MKNRYYGDKKDYFKYGLLDILYSRYASIGINWYLTDDSHGDMRFGMDINYLGEENWEYYNSDIFCKLGRRVFCNDRKIQYCKEDNVVKFKHEVFEQLPDSAEQNEYKTFRNNWHSNAKNDLSKCDLVFFDPDIGVKDNLPHGVIRGSEFATIEEINEYDWCDWLIIQFLQPTNRFDQLWANPVTKTAQNRKKKIVAFIHGHVAFLYVTNILDMAILRQVFKEWDTKICTQILIP